MVATAMLLATFAVPVGAQLASMAYGFPSVFQTGSTTAFSRDLATAQDLESVNVDFGAAGIGCGFPTISQTVDKSYYQEHTDFYHTEQTSAFNCPFVDVGAAGGYGCGLPGLGGYGVPYGVC